ncbi:uncharacterized protein LOC127073822 isoform X2 [Lathyrus oleraceus]|uniref:uncharacterized protein LOC127073822 isoform X2 n=1 Tax=Pisum sativum TaxID=3888 RepID=UPI0021D3B847|nr:uncharacterized protein LOC127073822 isoform X2 [Pisum sativum]
MEEVINDQSSVDVTGNSGSRSKLLRYPLRSSNKSKEPKPDASISTNPSESKRGRNTPSVSKSVGVLDFSANGKSSSAKPPRRLSNPVKASPTPSPKAVANITPISETRSRKSGNGQGPQTRVQTPVSDIFRSTARKFSLLSSASYWLNQIKLSESAAKHTISLGFFKLALEAGCEPFQKLQDELKSYLRRHQLDEHGELAKELVESYNIADIIEQPQVSESISQMPEEGARSTDDEVQYSSSTMGAGKLTPKCLNTDSPQLTSPPVTFIEPTKKETNQKKNLGSKLRENLKMTSANSKSASDIRNSRSVKKSEKPSKLETSKSGVKKRGKKADAKESKLEVSVSPTTSAGEKENMDVRSSDGDLIEVM